MTDLTPEQLTQMKWVDKKLTELKRDFAVLANTEAVIDPEAREKIREDYERASALSREILSHYGMTPEVDSETDDEAEESGYSYAFSSSYTFRRAEDDRKKNTDYDPEHALESWYPTQEEAEEAQAAWGGRTPTFIICRSEETGEVFPLDPDQAWI